VLWEEIGEQQSRNRKIANQCSQERGLTLAGGAGNFCEDKKMNEVYTIHEIKEKLEPVFRNAPIEKAVLFGSHAKGLQTASSDIDIAVDSQGKLLNINFYGVLEEMSECLKKRIDLIEFSEIRKGSLLYSTVTQEGVLLYERQR